MWYPDRNNARGPCEYDEVTRTPEGDGGNTEEGFEINEGNGMALESPFGSEVRLSFCGGDFLGFRILYLDFPFPDVVVGDTGTGTGVAVLDVSVEPDKEDGTLIEDMESGSKGILVFNSASCCAFVSLNLAVRGVSVFSLDSLDEDWAGDDGRERDCERERDGERAGVEGVCER